MATAQLPARQLARATAMAMSENRGKVPHKVMVRLEQIFQLAEAAGSHQVDALIIVSTDEFWLIGKQWASAGGDPVPHED